MTLDQALEIMNKVEYFSDGTISRYPSQEEFDAAMQVIINELNQPN